jgi:hypothetical protein
MGRPQHNLLCFDTIALHGDEFSVLLSFLFDKVCVDQSLVFLDNTMAKRKKDKRTKTIYKTLHRKLKIRKYFKKDLKISKMK